MLKHRSLVRYNRYLKNIDVSFASLIKTHVYLLRWEGIIDTCFMKMRKKEVVFDPEKRKEFLSGFRKRKNERRARAKEQLERSIKEERKRIRKDVKNSMATMKKTFQPLSIDPEIEDKFVEKDYEDEEVQINVIELATGNTQPNDQDDDSDNGSNSNETTAVESYINVIPGMEFSTGVEDVKEFKENKTKQKQRENTTDDNLGKIANKKLLDRMKKKKSLKEFKKSKVFKQKERVEKKKQQKIIRSKKYSTKNGNPGGKNRHNRSRTGQRHTSNRGRRK